MTVVLSLDAFDTARGASAFPLDRDVRGGVTGVFWRAAATVGLDLAGVTLAGSLGRGRMDREIADTGLLLAHLVS